MAYSRTKEKVYCDSFTDGNHSWTSNKVRTVYTDVKGNRFIKDNDKGYMKIDHQNHYRIDAVSITMHHLF
jgi:hypothetical protein